MKSLSEYLPFAVLIEDGVMLTKDEVFMRSARLIAKDLSYSDPIAIASSLRAINLSFRHVTTGWWVYITVRRVRINKVPTFIASYMPKVAQDFEIDRAKSIGDVYQNLCYVTFCYSRESKKGVGEHIFKEDGSDSLTHDLYDFINNTNEIFAQYRAAFSDIVPCDSKELLTFLHSTYSNFQPVNVPECPVFLDTYMGDKKVIPDSITRVDDDYIVAASVRDLPYDTNAGTVSRLINLPLEFTYTSRFQFLSMQDTKKLIKNIRKTHFQKFKGAGAIVGEMITKEESKGENTDAVENAKDSTEALGATVTEDLLFGNFNTSLILKGPNYKELRNQLKIVISALNDDGYLVKEETMNTPLVYFGSIPGNFKFNKREYPLSTRNLAHLFPISDVDSGDFTNEHIKEITGIDFPHAVCKSDNALYYLNLAVQGVGHTLVIGPTGKGKSILLNFLGLQFLRYPNSRVVFFDKDKSSQYACKNSGGKFFDICAPESDMKFNPFWGLDDEYHRNWLTEFLVGYFEAKNVAVSQQLRNEIYEAILSMSTQPSETWCFNSFRISIQNNDIRAALTPFVDGEFKNYFNTGDDSFDLSHWVTFETNNLMKQNKDLIQFILGYIFYRVSNTFKEGGPPVIMFIDEGWLALQFPYFARTLQEWFKVLRKKNVYIVFATQEAADAKKSPIFSTIINACMSRILLPNPYALEPDNLELYKALNLTESDANVLKDAEGMREYFYTGNGKKQKFELCLSPYQLSVLKTFIGGKK